MSALRKSGRAAAGQIKSRANITEKQLPNATAGHVIQSLLARAPKYTYKHIPYPASVIQKQQAKLRAKYLSALKTDAAQAEALGNALLRDSEPPHLIELSPKVRVFNPMGTSKFPVRPIVFINGLTTRHSAFYTMLREMNYPYGAAIIDIDHMGEDRSLQQKMKVYKDALKLLRIKSPAWVVGLDVGALTAFALAKEDPSLMPGITLLNASLHQVEKTLTEQFVTDKSQPLQWNCDYWSTNINTDQPAVAKFFNEPPQRITKERPAKVHKEILEKWKECFTNNTSLILNNFSNVADTKAMQKHINEAHTKLKPNVARDLISQFSSEWREMFHKPDDMFAVRHPLNLISSSYGIPQKNKARRKEMFLNAVNLYYHQHTQYVVSAQYLPSLNAYEALSNKNAARTVMETVEASLAPFDVHRDIQETFEWLRQTEKGEERLWSIHYQPHLAKENKEDEDKKEEEKTL